MNCETNVNKQTTQLQIPNAVFHVKQQSVLEMFVYKFIYGTQCKGESSLVEYMHKTPWLCKD